MVSSSEQKKKQFSNFNPNFGSDTKQVKITL